MIATHPIPAALARTGSTIRAAGPQSIEAMYAELSDTLRNGFVQNRERAENLEAAMQAM